MAFFATEEELPVATRVWKKVVKPPKPPIVIPPKPIPNKKGRIQVYWKCGKDYYLARNPRTGSYMYLCDQFFEDLRRSGFYEKDSNVKGSKVSKVEPLSLTKGIAKTTKSKNIKQAPVKITVDENPEGN